MNTPTTAPAAQRGNRAPTELHYIEDRLRCCLTLIEGTRGRGRAEERALVFALGEEFHLVLMRLWRCTR